MFQTFSHPLHRLASQTPPILRLSAYCLCDNFHFNSLLNFCNLAPNVLICALRIIKPRLFADGYTCSRDSAVILWMTLHIQALQGSDLHGTWRIETNQREER
jgi:hypothetical protein